MLSENKIRLIAKEVAAANLPRSVVQDILVELTADSQGRDALRITIVIKPDALERMTGDHTLDTLVEMQRRMREAGDDRFAIVEYATEEELQESGDT
jgi:hypothetical protein